MNILKIYIAIHISYLSCTALPLTHQIPSSTTIQPISTHLPIVFSHDANPFDANSYSFQFGSNHQNISKPNMDAFGKYRTIKNHNVLPLENPSKRTRQQRIHVFRPLFVYRQEQEAMRRREIPTPSIHPHNYYAYYPLHPYHYQHQYDNSDFYDPYSHKPFDYISNDLSNAASEYWYYH